MRLSLIAAMSENRVIGRNNQLPWHLPADLQHFKRITTGHTVIMGRKTFESVGKPLPNRRNVVVTRRAAYHAEGIEVAHGLDDAVALAKHEDEVFIIGGAEIFREALNGADRLYLTIVHAIVEGDTYFPEVNWDEWLLLEDDSHKPNDKNSLPFSFRRYERMRFASGQGPV